MRWLARLVVAFALLVGPAVSAVQAVTLKDLVDLKKAGISDAVLVALIDSDASVFQLTAAEVRTLRDAGFSDSLIISILNTVVKSRAAMQAHAEAVQREWAAQAPPPMPVAPPPSDPPMAPPVYAEPTIPPSAWATTPIVSEAPGYYRQPVYVPTPIYVAVPVAINPRGAAPKPAPVYWGFGGQRRPDTWKDPGGE